MTNSKKSKIAECISKLAEEICNVYEGEDSEDKEKDTEDTVGESGKECAGDDCGGTEKQEQVEEAAGNSHIKAVSFGWDGDPVPVSNFKSAADLLEAIYDASQAALNDGYYASLQIDFDQFDDDSDEVALVAEIRPIED